ncbi:MAG TPA: hypothetical protein VGF61_03520 [Candidatus Acidoferrum sp.]|jgi:hypothetical protein
MSSQPVSRSYALKIACLLLALALRLSGGAAFAQAPAGAGTGAKPLPDSPAPKSEAAVTTGTTPKFIGYITNRSLVFPDIATSPGPLGTGGKFKLFVNQSISPAYILAAGISSAVNQARNVPAAYGQGWDAYGDRVGEDMARASSNSFFATFLFASMFRQDPRFFPQSDPSLWGSVKYSAQRLVIIRNDAGSDVVNTSGLLGPFAAEGLANAYLPASEQTAGKSLERVGTDFAWRFAGNMFKNYWPKVFHSLGLNRLKVVPDPANIH